MDYVKSWFKWVLINRKNKMQLIEDLLNENFERKTCSFYRYVNIIDPHLMRGKLINDWFRLKVLGRVYIANEGINAQISVPQPNWDNFIINLESYNEFSSMHIVVWLAMAIL